MSNTEKKELYSYHNFMFPFRFDKIVDIFEDRHDFYKKKTFDERVNIDEKFKKSLEDSGWRYKKFKVDESQEGTKALNYNEIVYFHDFVKDSLFNMQEFKENATSYYFSKKVDISDSFKITIKDKLVYLLSLTDISLRIFDTGVAILYIELENKDYPNIDDILKINDFGRRIYPQYLGKFNQESEFWTQAPKDSLLASSISLCLDGHHIEEKFDYKSIPKDIKIASYLMDILGNSFTRDRTKKDKYYIQPSIDDRMFVLCWYGNDDFSNELKDYEYIKNEKWYEYVFVDGNGKTIHSPKMQDKLIEEATYDRWMNYKDGLTLFGMSRYSFVCISKNNWFSKNVLPLHHIQTMYFQMFTLLLVQRASILRFSDEVTALSDIDDNKLNNNTSSLYKNYIRFVNKLYFREITPQDQGLEIYNQARKVLRIDEDIKDLDNEIEELHRYVSMVEESKNSKRMNILQYVGFPLLLLSVVTGFFGMNIFPNEFLKVIANYLTTLF